MKILTITAAAAVALGTVAMADPGKSKGKGNNDQAQAMSGALQGNRGFASVAADVSGKNALGKGLSGWGNAGSSLDDGNSVSGRITSDDD
ncbi:hypothetical protein [Ruegeria lacuscaerulensis]|jgi:hypothetical protein|uniref:hypothetical protein n=1 Tax=Ruegeria lacuscaerulensis TaxID=55218 RepID=UPI00147FB18B|nr:hypothetical protein [Ruegeria lacuscaerulensis]